MRKKAATDGAGVSYLRPRHRRCDRESLPSARGICADRRRAASVAQIIDIDTLVALCRRGRGRVTSGSCRFQALRPPVAIQARGVVTDVAADRNHEVQALAADGLRPTVQALGLQQFAQSDVISMTNAGYEWHSVSLIFWLTAGSRNFPSEQPFPSICDTSPLLFQRCPRLSTANLQ